VVLVRAAVDEPVSCLVVLVLVVVMMS